MSRDLGGGPGCAVEWVRHTGIRARNGLLHAAGRNLPDETPTPRLQVWTRDKARLYRYLPTQESAEIRATPILFVMSLVTTAKVFDLQEDNSLVRRFLDAGHDVYLLDWGVPDAVESRNTLETYCDEYIPRAVRAVMDESGLRRRQHLRLLPGRRHDDAERRRAQVHAGAEHRAARHSRRHG